tara:strand:- start:455 stop:664 length:210 start_codon:yes stop_codon:yes gene_type:complete
MAEDKKEDSKSLQQQLDAITFKNDQVKKIRAIQEGQQRLKDNLGRNKARRVSSAGRIAGLQTLGNSFGK